MLNPRAIGKGTALATGFGQSSGDAIIIFDSAGSHNPRDIGLMLVILREGLACRAWRTQWGGLR
ncbi:MAG: hypothetical protein KKC28_03080 [Verrucomicrobia bacterium]|nr:hypothetical protein [Verrucomicrobiota bacterium]MBU1855951.1 hypothetical protein [Verrucomicrobiota bacterium]